MACLVSLEASDSEKMAFYLQESKDLGLTILPPDVNKSEIQFAVVDGKLLFGLQGIKNVGLASLENILSVRATKPFIDLLDFCKRIDLRTSNKRVIENLVCAGAFDTLPGSRAQKCQAIEAIIERATAHKEAVATGQMGLFGASDPQADVHEPYEFAPIDNWDAKTSLEKEKEVIGFYLSAHPFDSYKNQVRWLKIPTFAQTLAAQQPSDQEPVVVGCGIVKSSKTIFTKKNERMAFVTLEDAVSKAEIILFPSVFAKVEQWLSSHQVFVVKGALDVASAQQCKIKAQEFLPLDLVYDQWPITELQLTMPEIVTPTMLEDLQKQLPQGTIPLAFIVSEQGKQLRIKTKQKVAASVERLQAIENNAVDVSLLI